MNSSCLKKSTEPHKQTSGFTIIEVVLVLAIAGLIFLAVFLAVPNMQKSQRDNARRQDVGNVIGGVQRYLADNNTRPAAGTQPSDSGYFSNLRQATTVYVRGTELCQPVPTGATYEGWIIISPGCTCEQSRTNAGPPVSGAKFGSVGIILEATNKMYCKDY